MAGRCKGKSLLWLDCFRAALAGSNSNAIVHRQNKDFAVADLAFLARFRGIDDCVHGRFDEVIVDGNLQLNLSQQINRDLVSAVSSDLAFLSTKSLAIQNREAKHFYFRQRLLDRFQTARLNDRDNKFHGFGWFQLVRKNSVGCDSWTAKSLSIAQASY